MFFYYDYLLLKSINCLNKYNLGKELNSLKHFLFINSFSKKYEKTEELPNLNLALSNLAIYLSLFPRSFDVPKIKAPINKKGDFNKTLSLFYILARKNKFFEFAKEFENFSSPNFLYTATNFSLLEEIRNLEKLNLFIPQVNHVKTSIDELVFYDSAINLYNANIKDFAKVYTILIYKYGFVIYPFTENLCKTHNDIPCFKNIPIALSLKNKDLEFAKKILPTIANEDKKAFHHALVVYGYLDPLSKIDYETAFDFKNLLKSIANLKIDLPVKLRFLIKVCEQIEFDKEVLNTLILEREEIKAKENSENDPPPLTSYIDQIINSTKSGRKRNKFKEKPSLEALIPPKNIQHYWKVSGKKAASITESKEAFEKLINRANLSNKYKNVSEIIRCITMGTAVFAIFFSIMYPMIRNLIRFLKQLF
ncbi:MAG: hypothetical protein MJ247_05690 [Alphaproteobacteria bacterium]|nr:hypothetical protein [Alphaproteobacteria bacterium]